MRKFPLVSLFVTLSWCVFSQKSPLKFGDIPMEDMKMTSYDRDSSASALYLLDYGETDQQYDMIKSTLVMNFTKHVRIKILKSEGLSWANASILLYHKGKSGQEISHVKAAAYNLENGQIVKSMLTNENIFREKLITNYVVEKFTLPGVKVGSVIEYTYIIRSENNLTFPDWQFQQRIPVRWSEYWAVIPTAFSYQKYMQGYVPVSIYEVKPAGAGEDAFHWISKDVPAFKKEPFMTSEKDYVSKINFQLSAVDIPGKLSQDVMGSWDKMTQRMLENEDFGEVISKSGFLNDKVAELVDGIADPLPKLEKIYSYIKENMSWDSTKDIYSENLKKAIELKKGTSADLNLMLASMLDKAGFTVEMVLLSTRDHGFVRKEYPANRQFNYVICSVKLNDKILLLDATEKYLPYTILPERCLNGEGLVISKNNMGWIDIASKTKSRTVVTADFKLDEKGEINGKLTFTRDGYDAFHMRSKYNSKGEAAYIKDFLGTRNWQIDKTEFSDMKDITKPVTETHDVTINEHAAVTGNVIYINPFVDSQEEVNPFKSEKREYPVDFGSPNEKIYLFKIKLPEGFSVDELPPSKVIGLPGNAARFTYNAVPMGNSISITSSLQINKSLFLPSEYPNLREFYNLVIAKQAEQIVLKKK